MYLYTYKAVYVNSTGCKKLRTSYNVERFDLRRTRFIKDMYTANLLCTYRILYRHKTQETRGGGFTLTLGCFARIVLIQLYIY